MEKFFKELLDNGLEVLKKFNVFTGRSSRKELWRFLIAALIGGIALSILSAIMSAIPVLGKLFGIVLNIYELAIIGLSLSVVIRRLHDVNKSGWYVLPYLIGLVPVVIIDFIRKFVASRVPRTINPFDFLNDMSEYVTAAQRITVFNNLSIFFSVVGLAGFIILAVFCYREGDSGSNKYGPKPKK